MFSPRWLKALEQGLIDCSQMWHLPENKRKGIFLSFGWMIIVGALRVTTVLIFVFECSASAGYVIHSLCKSVCSSSPNYRIYTVDVYNVFRAGQPGHGRCMAYPVAPRYTPWESVLTLQPWDIIDSAAHLHGDALWSMMTHTISEANFASCSRQQSQRFVHTIFFLFFFPALHFRPTSHLLLFFVRKIREVLISSARPSRNIFERQTADVKLKSRSALSNTDILPRLLKKKSKYTFVIF